MRELITLWQFGEICAPPALLFLSSVCTCLKGRGQWCHLKQEGGEGYRRGGRDPPPTRTLRGGKSCKCSFFTTGNKHVVLLSEKSDYSAEQRLRDVFLHMFGIFWEHLIGYRIKRKWSFRGRINSSEMGNLLLMAFVLVHLPTGEV